MCSVVSGTAHTRRLPAATTSQVNAWLLRCVQSSPSTITGISIYRWRKLTMQNQIPCKELNVHILFNTQWCKNGNGSFPLLIYIFPSRWYSEAQEAPRHHRQEGKGNSTEERRTFSPQRRKVYTFTRARATPPPPPPFEHSGHNREHTSDRICSTFTSIVSFLPAVWTPPLIHPRQTIRNTSYTLSIQNHHLSLRQWW